MPDVYLPNGIIQPALGSTAWGSKQHANLALMDPLFSRVAALEAATPAEFLPNGTTLAQINEAIEDFPAGTRIYLPNETIDQRAGGSGSVLYANKEIELFGHPGGLSELYLDGNVTSSGTNHQIQIGKDSVTVIPRMRLSGFKMRHDRVAAPDMRTLAIDLAYRCNNLEIDHITYQDITSDFFIGRPWPWSTKWGCVGLNIHDCIGGCWEGFFNWHSGYLYDGHVNNNKLNESTMHATYQGPMLLELNIEQTVGGVEKFYASGNTSVLTGSAAGWAGNTLCIGYVHQSNYVRGQCYYHDIHVSDNIFNGYYFGAYLPAPNYSAGKLSPQKTLTVVTKNQFLNCGATPVYVWPNSAEMDSAKIVSNRCVAASTGSSEEWITEYAHDQEVWLKITNIAGATLQLGMQDPNSLQYQLTFTDATTMQFWVGWDPGYGLEWLQLGANVTITHAPDDEWKLRRAGSTITAYKNGSLVATRTDSSLTGPGYIGFSIPAGTSVKDFSGGNVGSSGLLDSFTRANEDPLNPTNWVNNGGWRTGSANDKIIFIENEGNGNVPIYDQSRLGAHGPIEIIESPSPNAWT